MLDRALDFLDRHINLEATAGRVEGLSLDRMRSLMGLLGDPQLDYPAIHITGTNGKGSTAAAVTALLSAAGLTVGTYGSPHVSSITERVQRNGEAVDDDTLARAVLDLEPVAALLDEQPSYFELLTAAALRWFADEAVDVAVVEVGKLGRFDATNVVRTAVAAVTNIGRDHTDASGDWRRAIAEEKAGIVKPDATLVLGESSVALQAIFEAEGPARLLLRGRDFGCVTNQLAVGGRLLDIRTPWGEHDDVYVSLHGAHQGDNVAVALTAVEAFLDQALSDEIVAEGLGELRIPGRFEVVRHAPLVVVDGAHNPDAAAAAARVMDEAFAGRGRRILVIGMLSDKDPAEMFAALDIARAERVICCTAPSPRAIPADRLAELAVAAGARDAEAVADTGGAVQRALDDAADDDVVFVVGSLYVAGAARDSLRSHESDAGPL